MASYPQTPGHGLMHFELTQALSLGQSALITHSGLQPVTLGLPKYPGGHSQTALSLIDLQIAFGPHGEGLQGSITTGSSVVKLRTWLTNLRNFNEDNRNKIFQFSLTLYWYWLAYSKSVTSVSIRTRADRNMVGNSAYGTDSAGSWARILTLASYACLVHRTVAADQALRSASFVRITVIIPIAFAHGGRKFYSASSVGSTRWRLTWINRCNWFLWRCCKISQEIELVFIFVQNFKRKNKTRSSFKFKFQNL